MFFKRIIVGLILMALGYLLIKGARKMVLWFGHNYTVERYLGAGGMYNFYRLGGILLFFAGIFYMFGVIDRIFAGIAGLFGIR